MITALDCTLKSPKKNNFQWLHCAVTGSRFLSNIKLFSTFCATGDVLLFLNQRNVFIPLQQSEWCTDKHFTFDTFQGKLLLWTTELEHNSERSEL